MSVNSFAREIGLSRAENLYQIKRGKYGISRDLAEMISLRYPNISKAWILTGEGSMFVDEVKKVSGIPFYKIDVEQYVSSLVNEKNDTFTIHIPFFEDCDFAALTYSKAMEPEIPHGSVVIFKHIDRDSIIPGNDYLVVSDRLTAIRRIRRLPDSGLLRLVAVNARDFDEFNLMYDEVRQVYAVKGIITSKSSI